jgi:holo-[acyl-carrier protein] synthase
MGDPHREMGKERERREKRIPRFAPFVPQGKRNDNFFAGRAVKYADTRVRKKKEGTIYRAPTRDNEEGTRCLRNSGQESAPLQGETLIIGMGVDLAEVHRIQKAIERHGEPFLRRVYTAGEREYCERFKNKYERYAGRFAAKEAAMKALGTGWKRGVRWVDFEVVRELGGRPTIRLDGEAKKIAEQLGVKRIALSITHTEAQALAQVIFEG